jgi:hypothetical protein
MEFNKVCSFREAFHKFLNIYTPIYVKLLPMVIYMGILFEQLKFKITAHAPSQGQVTLWENEWKASSQKLQSWLNPNYTLCQFMVEWLLDVPLQNFSFFKWIWQKSKMPIYITIGNNLTYIGVYIFRNLWKASLKLQTLLNSIQWFDL